MSGEAATETHARHLRIGIRRAAAGACAVCDGERLEQAGGDRAVRCAQCDRLFVKRRVNQVCCSRECGRVRNGEKCVAYSRTYRKQLRKRRLQRLQRAGKGVAA